MEIIYKTLNDDENVINKQIETKIGGFILSKCEKELQNNEEYVEMQEELEKAYSCNDIEQYKEIFNSIMELRKTVFYSISARYICRLID